jgi:hypothetical protein
MNIERERFLYAVMATTIATAAIGCADDPPPAPAQEPKSNVAADESVAQRTPEPQAAPAPAVEPDPAPKIEQVGPTRE